MALPVISKLLFWHFVVSSAPLFSAAEKEIDQDLHTRTNMWHIDSVQLRPLRNAQLVA